MKKGLFSVKKRIGAISATLVVVILAYFCRGRSYCTDNSKCGGTWAEIRHFLAGTEILCFSLDSSDEFRELLFPTNMIGIISTSSLLPALLGADTPETIAINPRQAIWVNINPHYIKNGELIDRWGNPYHFAFDTRKKIIEDDRGRIISKHFFMWSSGPNGINEWGEGDDICSWKQPHNKTWWRVLLGKTGKNFLDNFSDEK